MKYSVIIPVFNEENVITKCLESLAKQTVAKETEVIVIDDGSTDKTADKINNFLLLRQKHAGPGAARNLGAEKARGEILIFADADMEFAPDFLEKLTEPIRNGKTIGTFSKEEYLLNKNNPWARCWNLNLGRLAEKMHPDNYPDTQHVFRAILKSKFEEAGGFDANIGYTDDWTLARKLGTMAVVAPGAKYYHRNPESPGEVWRQARWFGKNEFLTGNTVRKFYNLWRYCPLLSVFKGAYGALKFREPVCLPFKIIYDTAVSVSVLFSFFKEPKSK